MFPLNVSNTTSYTSHKDQSAKSDGIDPVDPQHQAATQTTVGSKRITKQDYEYFGPSWLKTAWGNPRRESEKSTGQENSGSKLNPNTIPFMPRHESAKTTENVDDGSKLKTATEMPLIHQGDGVIYHVTSTEALESIVHQGLIPANIETLGYGNTMSDTYLMKSLLPAARSIRMSGYPLDDALDKLKLDLSERDRGFESPSEMNDFLRNKLKDGPGWPYWNAAPNERKKIITQITDEPTKERIQKAWNINIFDPAISRLMSSKEFEILREPIKRSASTEATRVLGNIYFSESKDLVVQYASHHFVKKNPAAIFWTTKQDLEQVNPNLKLKEDTAQAGGLIWSDSVPPDKLYYTTATGFNDLSKRFQERKSVT